MTRVLSLALVLSLGSLACSSADDTDVADGDETTTEDALRAKITPGTFKLYNAPQRGLTGRACDVFTALELAATSSGSTAKLSNVAEGLCAVMLAPNPRSFRLRETAGSCGIKIFTGSKTQGGHRRAIKITDYRVATCALGASPLVVEETLADGTTNTLYSASTAAPTPGTPGVWLTYAPRQCQTNPWNGAMPMHALASTLPGEAGDVDSYFRSQNVDLEEVGFLVRPTPMAVCAACQCPRGDELLVKAKDADDAKRLVDDFGFRLTDDKAVGTSAKSCNTNPWDGPGGSRGSAADLGQWAEGKGASVNYAGFVEPTTPAITCMACGVCPRGDRAVVLAKSAAGRAKLEALGFAGLD